MGGSILGKIGPPFLGWVCVIDSEYHQVEECANRLRQGGAEVILRRILFDLLPYFTFSQRFDKASQRL